MSKSEFTLFGQTLAVTIFVFFVDIYLSPDYTTYRLNWETTNGLDFSEVLWSVLNLCSRIIFSDFNYYLFVISLLIVYYKFKYLKNLVGSDLIFIFYISSFLLLHEAIQIRLAFGMIFVLRSMKYWIEEKNVKSFIFLIVASLIHLSLIFFIVVHFFRVVIKSKFTMLFCLLLIVLSYKFFSDIDYLQFLIDLISEGGEGWNLKLANYLYEFFEIGKIKGLPLQLYYVLLVYLISVFVNYNERDSKLNEIVRVSLLFIIPVLMIPNDTIISRFTELCFYFLPIIQFQIVRKLNRLKLWSISFVLVAFFVIVNFRVFSNQLL
jgi:hypothetical protein